MAVLRYLADGSYWVYLCHLPVVGLLQIVLLPVPAPAGLKFLTVFTVTMVLCLASYQVMVRYTFLGVRLHGPRLRGRRPAPPSARVPSPHAGRVRLGEPSES